MARTSKRVADAWRLLPGERRLAAFASIGLFLTLFLPWYQETVIAVGPRPQTASASVTGWQAFSFVEAAALLVATGVLTLLFQRAEGRAFHLPGGDGWVITVAGFWTSVLVVWRIFDKQSVHVHGPGTAVSGIDWGIFIALAVAGFLAYSGSRIRAAHRPEPPLPWEDASPRRVPATSGPGAGRISEPSAPRLRPVPDAPRPAPLPAARPPGWLTAPAKDRPAGVQSPRAVAAEEKRDRAVAAEERPTTPRAPRPVPASPPAARRRTHPEDQLTIPLPRED